ncbi:MAG TPA: M64 family metallopeptidase [Planctomycetota bacterium]|nr:M64 family metallopeptidase [Planctomycetota bacterium]
MKVAIPDKSPTRPPGAAYTKPASEAVPRKKSPMLRIAIGGSVAVLLLVVVLILTFKKSDSAPVAADPSPKATKGKEKTRYASGPASAPDASATPKGDFEQATLEKAILEMIDWGNLSGAAAAMRDCPKPIQDRVRPKFAAAAEPKYDAMLRDARSLAERGKLAEGRAHLAQIAQWNLPTLAERARKDEAALESGATAQSDSRPKDVMPAPKGEPASTLEKRAPEPAVQKKEPVPSPIVNGETKVGGVGVTVSARPARRGPYQPGGMADDEKQKKQTELAAAARKEQKGAKKAAAAKRAEWLSKLEKDKGIYDVTTLVDKGDSSKRVDVVIVSAGFPKSDEKRVNQMADQLKTALLKVDPFQNYPDYINFHRINVDDASVQTAKIKLTLQGNILTCDHRLAMEYASEAPSVDLVVVLCNVKNVRSTAYPPVITIDSDLNLGRTFLHEMGHAFAWLNDEYVDAGLAPGRPFKEDPENDFYTNVTATSNPKLAKWHYWTQDVWPAAHEMNRLPAGHKVGCYEGAAYQSKGVYRPEEKCLMQTGDKYCVVCFEQVEKMFYRLIAPIDDARPRRPLVGAWQDDAVVLEADAIRTMATGGERIGKFDGYWYVDSKPKNATSSKELTTVMSLRASELGPGVHEAGLRVDFSNHRIRRDDGWLSSSAGWKIDVTKYRKPKWEGPDKVQANVGEAVSFDIRIEVPDPATFKLEVKDFPERAIYENGKFSWTPAKAQQGAWRPRFVLTDGLRTVERTVEIAVLDTGEKNFEPVFSPMEAIVVGQRETLDQALEVVDVDGDNLVFTSTNLPEGAQLDVYDGIIRWKPGLHSLGRYPNIQIDVFDGRRHVKGSIEIDVEDHIRSERPKADPANDLRHASADVRARALDELGSRAKTYQFMEASRLLRDKSKVVNERALGILREKLNGADAPFIAMMIRDIEPYAWHFTDQPQILAWLGQLASKGEANTPEVKAFKNALKGIEKYNKDRGFQSP